MTATGVWIVLTVLCVIVEQVTRIVRAWGIMARVPAYAVAFAVGLVTLLLWRDVGILALFRPTYWIWDAIVTAIVLTAGSSGLHDLRAVLEGKKEVERATVQSLTVTPGPK